MSDDYFPPYGSNGRPMSDPPVTLASLRKHVKRYGLDNEAKYVRGHTKKQPVQKSYSTYRKLREDSVYQVALYYLGQIDYLRFVRDYNSDFEGDVLEIEEWEKP